MFGAILGYMRPCVRNKETSPLTSSSSLRLSSTLHICLSLPWCTWYKWFWNKKNAVELKTMLCFLPFIGLKILQTNKVILVNVSRYATTGYYGYSALWQCVKELGFGVSVFWDCPVSACSWFGRYCLLDAEIFLSFLNNRLYCIKLEIYSHAPRAWGPGFLVSALVYNLSVPVCN